MERAGECITAAGVAAAVDAVLERFLPEDEDAPCTSAEALAALQALGEVESRLAARRLDLAASVFYDRAVEDSRSVERELAETSRRGTPRGRVDPLDAAAGQIGAALTVPPAAARDLVRTGRLLVEHFPVVRRALAEGHVDESTARLLLRELDAVSEEVSPGLERDAVRWASATPGRRVRGRRLAERIRRAAVQLDPEHVRERRARALARRRVGITRLPLGLARIEAVVSAEAAELVDTALETLARRAARHEVPVESASPADRRAAHGRRRADALVSLCAEAFLPAAERGDGPLVGLPAVQYVVVGDEPRPGGAGAGVGSRPGGAVAEDGSGPRWLVGYGWVPGPLDEAHPTRPGHPVHPVLGPIVDTRRTLRVDLEASAPDSRRYRVPASLDRLVRLRDGGCRFPGCDAPAAACDLDHVVPFDHADPERGGDTSAEQLLGECRLHHRLKTHGGWRVEQCPELGGALVTAPDGGRYLSRPEGPLGRRVGRAQLARTLTRLRGHPAPGAPPPRPGSAPHSPSGAAPPPRPGQAPGGRPTLRLDSSP